MVVKGDQQRIRALIKDTLTLLCKNGLNFESQFCMEALIVFTLDNDDVFHVSINETVKNALAAADASSMAGARDEVEETEDEAPVRFKPSQQQSQPSGASRKRSYQDIKFEVEEQREGSSSSDGQTIDTGGDGFGQDSSHRRDLNPQSNTNPPPPKRQELDQSDQLPEDEDIVIIKEEDDNNAEYEGDDTNSSYAYDPGSASGYPYGDPDLAQTTSLFPESTQGSPGIWPNISQQSGSATVTSEGMEGNSFSSDQLLALPNILECRLCQKTFKNRYNWKRHMDMHRGIYQYYCSFCKKGFSSSASLQGHVSKHTGIKLFQCEFCTKSFSYKHHLVEHTKSYHVRTPAWLQTQQSGSPQSLSSSGPPPSGSSGTPTSGPSGTPTSGPPGPMTSVSSGAPTYVPPRPLASLAAPPT